MTEMATVFKKECCIEKNGDIKIPIAYLPAGDFVYPVTATNPFLEEIELVFIVKSHEKCYCKKKLLFSAVTATERFHFSTSSEHRDLEVIISLTVGSKCWLNLPVSPLLAHKIEASPSRIKETVIKIISEIENDEDDVDDHSHKDSYGSTTPVTVESKRINGSQVSHFKGMVNLEQAQKQLDYVIYNKLFHSEGTRGFKKWKESFYRRVLIFLYKALSRNPSRRVYFAKLYRNYINNNILADNLQAV
jgi:hypothetical protein